MRTVACLLVGSILWLGWGAVGGVAYLRVPAGSYLLLVVLAGATFGLLWPGPHMRTGLLLVVPGLVSLLGPGDYPDLAWWALTLVFGMWGAATSHWLVVEAGDWRRARAKRRRRQHS